MHARFETAVWLEHQRSGGPPFWRFFACSLCCTPPKHAFDPDTAASCACMYDRLILFFLCAYQLARHLVNIGGVSSACDTRAAGTYSAYRSPQPHGCCCTSGQAPGKHVRVYDHSHPRFAHPSPRCLLFVRTLLRAFAGPADRQHASRGPDADRWQPRVGDGHEHVPFLRRGEGWHQTGPSCANSLGPRGVTAVSVPFFPHIDI